MPKRPGIPKPVPGATPFSITRQMTGPPFGHSLESAELRHKLLLEMASHGDVAAGPPAGSKPPVSIPRRRTGKARGRKHKA